MFGIILISCQNIERTLESTSAIVTAPKAACVPSSDDNSIIEIMGSATVRKIVVKITSNIKDFQNITCKG